MGKCDFVDGASWQVRLPRRQYPPVPLRLSDLRPGQQAPLPDYRYLGAINLVAEICNKFIDIKDETCEERFFEMMR